MGVGLQQSRVGGQHLPSRPIRGRALSLLGWLQAYKISTSPRVGEDGRGDFAHAS